jgi:hypothetical protein
VLDLHRRHYYCTTRSLFILIAQTIDMPWSLTQVGS